MKHRLVEKIGSGTADALGLSRAILCNDILVQRLDALEKTENFYKGLVAHAKSVLHAFFDLFQIYKGMFSNINDILHNQYQMFNLLSDCMLFQYLEMLLHQWE